MNLSNLRPAKKAKKNKKRIGRGPGSGYQKTSGRGSKGQKSISGFSRKTGFEGGQMPLQRRLPKRGFTNIFKDEYNEINLERIEAMAKTEIKPEDLAKAGIVKRKQRKIKILGQGKITSAKKIHAHKFSRSAQEKIEKAGGKAILIGKS